MGQKSSVFSQDQLEEYQDCTFFTKKEIIHIHKRFRSLFSDADNRNITIDSKLGIDDILQLPELKVNPFRKRICQVFSDEGQMGFEDFLDMMSVFSEGATRDVKGSYAFRIYDFDNDGYLSKEDLIDTIKCLCGEEELKPQEMQLVADKIIEEADLDGDHRLSYVEFEHVISRAPDFINTFRIRI